jgi:hydroxyacylglutathione hydrolase
MNEILRPIVKGFTGGPFSQNCYVLSCPETHEGILVDPGGAVEGMLAYVRESAIEVASIILTHAHIDHVDGVAAAKAATAAPIRLHPADEQLYRQAPVQAQWFGLRLDPLPPLDGYLEEGEPVAFGRISMDVAHTPGHAPGHVVLTSPGICIVGDCVFMGSIGRTDLPGGDLATLMASIRNRILTLPDDTKLYPGHGPTTTVGHERVANPFIAPQFGGSRFA